MRLARWRPVCPECGYSLRGLTAPRCPECGERFPTAARTYRRWAFRRLPWDRAQRHGMLGAWLVTWVSIVVLPWRAARGLLIPDHWGRAIRWAGASLLVSSIAAMLLGNDQYFARWLWALVRPETFRHPYLFMGEPAPADRVAVWMIESLAVWLLGLSFAVLIACLLSVGVPGRHRAAKLGGVKWSLYATALHPLTLAAWYTYFGISPPVAQAPWPLLFSYDLPPPAIPLSLLAGVFGMWWAVGMVRNPYDRRRGLRGFIVYVLLYAGVWWVATNVLFRPDVLEAWL